MSDQEKATWESTLIDYIDGTLTEADRDRVAQAIREQPAVGQLYQELQTVMQAMADSPVVEPPRRMRDQFEAMLNAEVSRSHSATPVRTLNGQRMWYRVAAVITLLIVAAGGTYWYQQQQHLLALEAELREIKAGILQQLHNTQSPSQRLLAVKAANQTHQPDNEIVSALIRTMNEDPNSNVRLAAMEALGRFQHEPPVRQALIASLARQTDPVVQIALIQLLVEMKDKEVMKPLQQIIDNEEVLPAVRDEAHAGIFRLS